MVVGHINLIAANLIFMLSSFTPVRVGGAMWVVVLVACLAADLVFLPALMTTRLFDRAARGRPAKPKAEESAYAGAGERGGQRQL
jgi:hypothetical protein